MLNIDFSLIVLYLAAYSMMGWVCEVIYCSVPAKHFINRGFLNGPYCPIYGFGAVIILTSTYPLIQYPMLVFVLSLCTATILEYFTGWLMESLFQTRWWDYSSHQFNIKGRICPINSFLFGIGGIAVTYFLHPFVVSLMGSINGDKQRVLASVMMMVFLIDMFYTLNSLLKLNERLGMLKNYLSEIERYKEEYVWLDRNDLSGSLSRLKEICRDEVDNENLTHILVRLENMVAKREWEFRLIKSFPNMKPRGLETLLEDLRSTWEQHKELLDERRETIMRRIWNVTKRWSRQAAVKAKETSGSFVQRPGSYKLMWVFAAAILLGFVMK